MEKEAVGSSPPELLRDLPHQLKTLLDQSAGMARQLSWRISAVLTVHGYYGLNRKCPPQAPMLMLGFQVALLFCEVVETLGGEA
jgi:hypothetical protein